MTLYLESSFSAFIRLLKLNCVESISRFTFYASWKGLFFLNKKTNPFTFSVLTDRLFFVPIILNKLFFI